MLLSSSFSEANYIYIMKFTLFYITAVLAATMTCCSCENRTADGSSDGDKAVTDDYYCMVRFVKEDSKEYFNIAVRDQYRDYIWYVFRVNHYKDHSGMKYMDLWRIDWAYQGSYDEQTGEMTNILDKIITDGESESVLKDYGQGLNTSGHIDTDDFTGGFHGDERIDIEDGCGVTFYIDGEALAEKDIEESFEWRKCDIFKYEQKSTMHKTALKSGENGAAEESDHHIIADHHKTTTFGNSGYITENTLTMRDEIDFYWYSGICCVGTNVAVMGCNEDMAAVTFDRSGANRLDGTGKCRYMAWNTDKGIEVNVVANMTAGADDSLCRMFVWDTGNYAKFYRRYPANGAYRTRVGETFSAIQTVTFMTR